MRYKEEYWIDVKRVIQCIPKIENLRNAKLLITGATGMIGSSVADILFYLNKNENYDTKLYLLGREEGKVKNRFSTFALGEDYEFIEYDATKEISFDCEVDYVIHAASNADPVAYTECPVETMLANLVGTNNLLRYIKEKKGRRFLYLSSSEVYGKKTDNSPYSENDYGYVDITNSRACYPSSKRAAETLCVSYGEQFDVDTVIVRPGHIYGPTILDTDSRASAQFTRNAINGESIIMKSAGEQMRSYCYTLDCASAILAVLINGEKGNAYNISNKDSVVSIRSLAEEIARCANVEVVFENPSDKEKKGYNMMSNSSLDATKLEKLGWKAYFDLEKGVEKTVLYLK
ncbi:MAG: NAD-dependent epimerase/dehydratase family protein [Lachnospiraceae bacterium]|nr:NAD-dependent epimerase/dehydratase family protein [Lachnospiraceae bacterium]